MAKIRLADWKLGPYYSQTSVGGNQFAMSDKSKHPLLNFILSYAVLVYVGIANLLAAQDTGEFLGLNARWHTLLGIAGAALGFHFISEHGKKEVREKDRKIAELEEKLDNGAMRDQRIREVRTYLLGVMNEGVRLSKGPMDTELLKRARKWRDETRVGIEGCLSAADGQAFVDTPIVRGAELDDNLMSSSYVLYRLEELAAAVGKLADSLTFDRISPSWMATNSGSK